MKKRYNALGADEIIPEEYETSVENLSRWKSILYQRKILKNGKRFES
jgi:hypothetical protein